MKGLAVDWVTMNIYWTDALYKVIGVVPLAISNRLWKTLVHSNLSSPQDVVVNPLQQWVLLLAQNRILIQRVAVKSVKLCNKIRHSRLWRPVIAGNVFHRMLRIEDLSCSVARYAYHSMTRMWAHLALVQLGHWRNKCVTILVFEVDAQKLLAGSNAVCGQLLTSKACGHALVDNDTQRLKGRCAATS